MKVTIKSAEEIEKMRRAGEILAAVHQNLAREIKPGMSTLDIDRLGEEMIRGYGCIPSFKNYCGYPASICVSVNEEVVHGIPTDERIIKEGDITLFINVKSDAPYSDGARVSSLYNVLTIEIGVICHKSCRKTINGIRELVVTDRIRQILTKTPELQGIGDLTIKSCSPMYSIPYYDYNGYSTQFEIIYWKDAYNNEIS